MVSAGHVTLQVLCALGGDSQSQLAKRDVRESVRANLQQSLASNSTCPRLKIFFAFFGSQIFIHKLHEELAVCFPCLK